MKVNICLKGIFMQKRRRNYRSGRKIKNTLEQRSVKYIKIGLVVLAVVVTAAGIIKLVGSGVFRSDEYVEKTGAAIDACRPDMEVALLTVNPYSRPGQETERITGIVIHYTANPGSGAMANRDYFEGLKDSHETNASSHFVVGLNGEVVQCIPTWEVAYASNGRNKDTVSIECCHPDESGVFDKDTYNSMVELTAWLCLKFDLNEKDVIRHYDVSGKNCPKHFVEDENAWDQFRKDVKKQLKKIK